MSLKLDGFDCILHCRCAARIHRDLKLMLSEVHRELARYPNPLDRTNAAVLMLMTQAQLLENLIGMPSVWKMPAAAVASEAK